MQSPGWYLRRIRAMSGREVAWRIQCELRDLADRLRFAGHLYPALKKSRVAPGRGFRCTTIQTSADQYLPEWRTRLLSRAENLLQGRLSYFNCENVFHSSPIDWNRDHSAGRQSPLSFAPALDYRNFDQVGDCKLVWEPNRHHHLVVLARAYAVTGDERFARGALDQLDSWLQACPFGRGMNWRSPLELGIRLINWVWSLDLIRDSASFESESWHEILNSVYLHLWEITRKYSRYSSANNHLVGEAAGVYVGTSYFNSLPHASEWREQAREVLCRELLAQTYSDGCTREQALGYEVFVLQFYLIVGLVARSTKDDLPQEFWNRLERMLEFVSALAQGGPLPMFGDCDDGYVLDLGGGPSSYVDVLPIGAALFERPDLCASIDGPVEALRWLPVPLQNPKDDGSVAVNLRSRGFAESGYYLLQSGRGESRISVTFDCGEIGFGSIAAHGHADALSITLRAFGEDILVDPGTFDYFSFPEWREYFRSSRAHNTVVIDGADQSEMAGPFLWDARANARCLEFTPARNGGIVVGEHDGYSRLRDACTHRRAVQLHGNALSICDEITTTCNHTVELLFHVAESCEVRVSPNMEIEIVAKGGTVSLRLDPILSVEIVRGREKPITGWVSRSYHSRVASTTIVGRAQVASNTSLRSEMRVMPAVRAACVSAAP